MAKDKHESMLYDIKFPVVFVALSRQNKEMTNSAWVFFSWEESNRCQAPTPTTFSHYKINKIESSDASGNGQNANTKTKQFSKTM